MGFKLIAILFENNLPTTRCKLQTEIITFAPI